MSRRVFIDVAVTNSKKRKKHYCYDPAEGRYFKIGRLTELRQYDEVYIDTMVPSSYGEVGELLDNGVRVYLLREPKLVKKMRQQNNLRKSDENDAYVLSLITKDYFRELTARDIEVRVLVNAYLEFDGEVRRLKNKAKNRSGVIDYSFYQDLAKELELKKKEVGQKILKLMENDRFYREVVRYFGYRESIMIGMLTILVDFSRRVHQILDYLGLHKMAGNHYNHKARSILSMIANNFYLHLRRNTLPAPEKYLKIIKDYPMKKAEIRIQTEMIRDMRRIWLNMNNKQDNPPLANPMNGKTERVG